MTESGGGWFGRLWGGGTRDSVADLRREMGLLSQVGRDLVERCAALERQRDADAAELGRLRESCASLAGELRTATDTIRTMVEDKLKHGALEAEKLRLGVKGLAMQMQTERDRAETLATALFERIEALRGRGKDAASAP